MGCPGEGLEKPRAPPAYTGVWGGSSLEAAPCGDSSGSLCRCGWPGPERVVENRKQWASKARARPKPWQVPGVQLCLSTEQVSWGRLSSGGTGEKRGQGKAWAMGPLWKQQYWYQHNKSERWGVKLGQTGTPIGTQPPFLRAESEMALSCGWRNRFRSWGSLNV